MERPYKRVVAKGLARCTHAYEPCSRPQAHILSDSKHPQPYQVINTGRAMLPLQQESQAGGTARDSYLVPTVETRWHDTRKSSSLAALSGGGQAGSKAQNINRAQRLPHLPRIPLHAAVCQASLAVCPVFVCSLCLPLAVLQPPVPQLTVASTGCRAPPFRRPCPCHSRTPSSANEQKTTKKRKKIK